MFGVFHDYLNGPWEEARGFLIEELEQLRNALTAQLGQTFNNLNQLTSAAFSGDPTPATRYVANTGVKNAPTWDRVNLSNGVQGTLALSHLPTATAETFLGRGDSSSGDYQPLTPGAGIGIVGTEVVTQNPAIREIEVVIIDSNILTLPTTPVEIIPAPGAGFIITPLLTTVFGLFSGGGYTNVDPDAWMYLRYNDGGQGSNLLANVTFDGITALTDFFDVGGMFLFTAPTYATQGAAAGVYGSIPISSDIEDNQGISLFFDNLAAGNLTAGDTGNTLVVRMRYILEEAP